MVTVFAAAAATAEVALKRVIFLGDYSVVLRVRGFFFGIELFLEQLVFYHSLRESLRR